MVNGEKETKSCITKIGKQKRKNSRQFDSIADGIASTFRIIKPFMIFDTKIRDCIQFQFGSSFANFLPAVVSYFSTVFSAIKVPAA